MTDSSSNPSRPWWQNALIYQIYPLSFNAPQGGYGTLRGIIDKVDYIADLGVDAVWFSPFFKSPMTFGMGYNPSNYYHVEETFGTDADCKEMIDKLHAKGIKVIFDMVFNHTAQEHPWFQASADPQSGDDYEKYKDFYIWADPAPGEGPPESRFPNNWPTVTPMQGGDGRAWKWNESRQQFYLHSFAENMPDLNLQNPIVQEELRKVMAHWQEQGVDGFRCDAVPHYFKVGIPADGYATPGEPGKDGIYQEQNQSVITAEELVRWAHKNDASDKRPKGVTPIDWNDSFFDPMRYQGGGDVLRAIFGGLGDDVAVIGECSAARDHSASIEDYLQGGMRQCFMGTLENPRDPVKFVASTKAAIEKFGMDRVNFAGGNHDNNRMVSRWGFEKEGARGAAFLAALTLSLPGSICLFQGDELGLPDDDKSKMQRKGESTRDKEKYDPKNLAHSLYDSETSRGMMPWLSNQMNKGWLAISRKMREFAVDVQEKDEHSTLKFYRQFIEFRKEHPALREGTILFDEREAQKGIIKFTRECEGVERVTCRFDVKHLTMKFDVVELGHAARLGAQREEHVHAPHLPR
ncbi:MAG: hypothetical protein IT567_06515 [Alphaproteobacteria bacterium]|nr:hypothetical protein [Alphaproteobacteria bacterium]